MSNTALTYLIAAVVGVDQHRPVGLAGARARLHGVHALVAADVAVVMSVYVLAAMLGAGGLIGALFLWYYDRIA